MKAIGAWVVLCLSVAGSAQAQVSGDTQGAPETIPVDGAASPEPVADDETGHDKSRFVEEIVVTAQKREENMRDVPISINAFSGALLDAKGVTSIDSLPNITPGLVINNTAGFAITYIRGVGSDAFLAADPSVANYIDGIYFPFIQGLAQDLGAIERIEVLKGPQGTLFGRNAVGGAINILTRDPGGEPETSIQTSYGRFDDRRMRIYTSFPLSDSLAMSVSAAYSARDNYYDGEVAGHGVPDETGKGARIKLKWTPLDNLQINLAGLRLKQSGISGFVAPNGEPSLVGRLVGIEPMQGYTTALDAPAYQRIDNTVGYGNAKLETGWFDVKVLGSYQRIKTPSWYDYDGSTLPLVSFNNEGYRGAFKTAELQLISNDDSWGSDWLQWIAGGYYFTGVQGFDPIRLVAGEINIDQGMLLDLDLPPAAQELIGRLVQQINGPSGNLIVHGLVGTKSRSVFGQATFKFTDWVSLVLGGRYQVERRSLKAASTGVEQADGGSIDYADYSGLHDTTRSFKPKASLNFHLFDDTLVYLSYQEAIKASTFNIVNILPLNPPEAVKPEELLAYEVGVKTSLLDDAIQLNFAAFQYDTNNLQVQFISLLNGGAVSFENAGGSLIRGIEFDSTSRILPDLLGDVVFSIGGAYIPYAKYTGYTNASGFNEDTGLYSGGNDYTGYRTVRAPRFSGTASLSKTFFFDASSIELTGDVLYNSGFKYLAQGGASPYLQPKYHTISARASYNYEPWGTRLTLFCDNLTNEKYTLSKFELDFGPGWLLAPPRVIGLRINWDF